MKYEKYLKRKNLQDLIQEIPVVIIPIFLIFLIFFIYKSLTTASIIDLFIDFENVYRSIIEPPNFELLNTYLSITTVLCVPICIIGTICCKWEKRMLDSNDSYRYKIENFPFRLKIKIDEILKEKGKEDTYCLSFWYDSKK